MHCILLLAAAICMGRFTPESKSPPAETTIHIWTPGLLGSAAAGLRGRKTHDEEGAESTKDSNSGTLGSGVHSSGLVESEDRSDEQGGNRSATDADPDSGASSAGRQDHGNPGESHNEAEGAPGVAGTSPRSRPIEYPAPAVVHSILRDLANIIQARFHSNREIAAIETRRSLQDIGFRSSTLSEAAVKHTGAPTLRMFFQMIDQVMEAVNIGGSDANADGLPGDFSASVGEQQDEREGEDAVEVAAGVAPPSLGSQARLQLVPPCVMKISSGIRDLVLALHQRNRETLRYALQDSLLAIVAGLFTLSQQLACFSEAERARIFTRFLEQTKEDLNRLLEPGR